MGKLSFKTQLRFTAYGIVGFLVPALAVSTYTGTHGSAVAAIATGVAFLTGVLVREKEEGEDVTGS